MNTEEPEKELSPEQSLKLITGMIEKIQDDKLRQLAKKRVGFKAFLAIAFLLNATLIGIWYFTSGLHSYFWPMWPIMVWTILLIITFVRHISVPLFFPRKKSMKN